MGTDYYFLPSFCHETVDIRLLFILCCSEPCHQEMIRQVPKTFTYYVRKLDKLSFRPRSVKKYFVGAGKSRFDPLILVFSKLELSRPKWVRRVILDAEQDALGFVEYPPALALSPRIRTLRRAIWQLKQDGIINSVKLEPPSQDLKLYKTIRSLKIRFYREEKREIAFESYKFVLIDPLQLVETQDEYSCIALGVLMILDFILWKGGRILTQDIANKLGLNADFVNAALDLLYSLGLTYSTASRVTVKIRLENKSKIDEYLNAYKVKIEKIAEFLREQFYYYASLAGLLINQKVPLYDATGFASYYDEDLDLDQKILLRCVRKFPAIVKMLIERHNLLQSHHALLLQDFGILKGL